MKNIKEEFINKVITELTEEEIMHKNDIPEYLTVLEHLDDKIDNEDFLEFIEKNIEDLCIYIDFDEEYRGELTIQVSAISEVLSYDINILFYPSWEGYCECKPIDEGYNEIHKCCGKYCDWDIPQFYIEKKQILGGYRFEGLQRDLWEAQDEFMEKYFGNESLNQKKKNEEKEKFLKDLAYFEEMIKYTKEKLKELED